MQTMFVEVKCALGESYQVAEELVEIEAKIVAALPLRAALH